MGLLRSIVGGFGFTIGARAAEEGLDSADKALDEHDQKHKESERVAAAKTIKVEDQIKAMAKEAEARKKAQATREKEVEKELSVLKKRLAIEAKKR